MAESLTASELMSPEQRIPISSDNLLQMVRVSGADNDAQPGEEIWIAFFDEEDQDWAGPNNMSVCIASGDDWEGCLERLAAVALEMRDKIRAERASRGA